MVWAQNLAYCRGLAKRERRQLHGPRPFRLHVRQFGHEDGDVKVCVGGLEPGLTHEIAHDGAVSPHRVWGWCLGLVEMRDHARGVDERAAAHGDGDLGIELNERGNRPLSGVRKETCPPRQAMAMVIQVAVYEYPPCRSDTVYHAHALL